MVYVEPIRSLYEIVTGKNKVYQTIVGRENNN